MSLFSKIYEHLPPRAQKIVDFGKNHKTEFYGATTAILLAASAYGSLSPQADTTGHTHEIFARNLPDSLLATGDFLTAAKAGTIAFFVRRFVKSFDNSRYRILGFSLSSGYESILEGLQFFLDTRYFDPIDYIYIISGSAIGANADDLFSKIKSIFKKKD